MKPDIPRPHKPPIVRIRYARRMLPVLYRPKPFYHAMMPCALDPDVKATMIELLDQEIALTEKEGPGVVSLEDLKISREYIGSCSDKAGETGKKGRKLSGYQLFMKKCASKPEKGGEGKPFKECIEDWREAKAKAK